MEFIKALELAELPAGKMVRVEVGGKEILVANVAGSIYAITRNCTHLGGPLAKGKLEGSTVTCPWHGAQFDVKTGQALGEAKIAFLKMKVKSEECYPVKVEGTTLLIGIG